LENAATSFGIIQSLINFGYEISIESMASGFNNVCWPGRFEIVQRQPLIIFDCAHNQNSSHNLAESIKEFFPERKVKLILGISNDKDRRAICRELNDISQSVITTKADHPRAGQFRDDELKDVFPGKHCLKTESVREALNIVFEKCTDDDIVLVTGSLFVVSEARRICKK